MKHEDFTAFIIHLTDGTGRQYKFPYVMDDRTAHEHLDPLLDEMDGGNILSPVYIVKSVGGRTSNEQIKIYSPADREEGLV